MVLGQLDESNGAKGADARQEESIGNKRRKNWILVRDIRLGKTDFEDHRLSPDRFLVESRGTSQTCAILTPPINPTNNTVRWKRHLRFLFPGFLEMPGEASARR